MALSLSLTFFLKGLALGLTAAASPGPTQTFLIGQSLAGGWRRGAPVAFAPLISDGPIIFLTILVLEQLPSLLIRIISLTGGLFVLYLAWGLWRQWLNERGQQLNGRLYPKWFNEQPVCFNERRDDESAQSSAIYILDLRKWANSTRRLTPIFFQRLCFPAGFLQHAGRRHAAYCRHLSPGPPVGSASGTRPDSDQHFDPRHFRRDPDLSKLQSLRNRKATLVRNLVQSACSEGNVVMNISSLQS